MKQSKTSITQHCLEKENCIKYRVQQFCTRFILKVLRNYFLTIHNIKLHYKNMHKSKILIKPLISLLSLHIFMIPPLIHLQQIQDKIFDDSKAPKIKEHISYLTSNGLIQSQIIQYFCQKTWSYQCFMQQKMVLDQSK